MVQTCSQREKNHQPSITTPPPHTITCPSRRRLQSCDLTSFHLASLSALPYTRILFVYFV